MKKSLILLCLLTIVVFACRKKELRDVYTLESLGAIHCLNGIMDSTELGIDCGGECNSCVQLTSPCSLTDNSIEIAISFLGTESVNITSTELIIQNGFYSFKAITDNGSDYLSIVFSSKPEITKKYIGTFESTSISSEEVFVKYYSNSSGDKIGSGDVYVNYVNNVYVLSSCDYSFHVWGSSASSNNQNFNITFN